MYKNFTRRSKKKKRKGIYHPLLQHHFFLNIHTPALVFTCFHHIKYSSKSPRLFPQFFNWRPPSSQHVVSHKTINNSVENIQKSCLKFETGGISAGFRPFSFTLPPPSYICFCRITLSVSLLWVRLFEITILSFHHILGLYNLSRIFRPFRFMKRVYFLWKR